MSGADASQESMNPGRWRPAIPPAAEAGSLPFSFEPEETLGDTDPMPLDEPASAALKREARAHARMYLLVAAFAMTAYFGWIA